MHPLYSGFGLASHLGVLSGLPSIGVGKKLFHVDGLEQGADHKQQVGDLHYLSLIKLTVCVCVDVCRLLSLYTRKVITLIWKECLVESGEL